MSMWYVSPIWSADRQYIDIFVHEKNSYTVPSTPQWSYLVTHAHTHAHYEVKREKDMYIHTYILLSFNFVVLCMCFCYRV